MNRRDALKLTFTSIAAMAVPIGAHEMDETQKYGLIVQIKAIPGKRDELIVILDEAFSEIPGMLSHIISKDKEAPDTLWVTEAWQSHEAHSASFAMPSVKDAMAKGRPLIAEMGQRIETIPVAGLH